MARPKSPDPKRNRLELRLTSGELESIDYVAKALGVSRSEAVIQTMEERADEIFRVREARRYAEDQEKAD